MVGNAALMQCPTCELAKRIDVDERRSLVTSSGNALHAREPSWLRRRTVKPGERIASCGTASDDVFFLCKGWAFRFVILPDGRRQIFNFLLPGDAFSAEAISEERLGSSVDALTKADVAAIPRREFKTRLAQNQALGTIWADNVSRQLRTSDQLLVVLGRCTAEQRVGYLILELTRRMRKLGLTRAHWLAFPPRLSHLADALGLTPECVCRIIGRFRKRGILGLSSGRLEILDVNALERVGSLRYGEIPADAYESRS
jgi:CRP-like cAMP-binding protein